VPQSTQYTKEDEQLLDEEMEQLETRAKRVFGSTLQKPFASEIFSSCYGQKTYFKIFLF
jgi:hypothetical protein